MASRSTLDLDPRVRAMCVDFLTRCQAAALDVIVTCTYRSNAEQASLYAQGRTAPGAVVTNARPGQSLHNRTVNGAPSALAFDVVPLRDGKCVWSSDDPIWQKVGAIGEAAGLEWAGRWETFREYPHFQSKER
jgi:peptidoglycan L-alanyl-D-glutamate endopeptidase CwlK